MNGLAAILVGFAAAVAAAPSVSDKAVLRASTEQLTPASVRPSHALTQAILTGMDKDVLSEVDDCIVEQGLKRGDYAALLRAVKIRNAAERTLWFVRPSLNPYCSRFYGAHLFRYFLVEEFGRQASRRYRILFQNGGDAFAVYAHLSHGLNDIEATGCIATGCRSAKLSFDGHHYRPFLCKQISLEEHSRERARERRCGSDEGSDIQSSGLAAE